MRGGCSRRVLKIVYLAVNKGNIFINFFTSENIHHKFLSCCVSDLNINFRSFDIGKQLIDTQNSPIGPRQ